jgi:hypothetical protein
MVCIISPHQYLSVKISDEKFINVDAWGRAYGIELGKYTRGFYRCF